MSDLREDALAGWASLFEGLSPDRLDEFRALSAPDIRFRDPFNDVVGVDMLIRVFEDMFQTCDNPRFEVLDRALSDQAGYLKWRFRFSLRRGGAKAWVIEGMSEVHFDDKGRVTAHLDHWDAASQFYSRLPVLRGLIGIVRRRMAVEAR